MIQSLIKHIPVLRHIMPHPRLITTGLFMALLMVLLPDDWRGVTRSLVAWDASLALYLVMVVLMINNSTTEAIQSRAAAQDEGGTLILTLTVCAAIASLAAIMLELAAAKSIAGVVRGESVALAGITVLLSWLFMQTMFALHYAHAYYIDKTGKHHGGLEFPAQYTTPDYWDFVYFSFVIGTAAQTADINITSRTIRRIVTTHCVIVFFFNTAILALTINIGASLV